MLHSFFSSLAKSRNLSLFSLSFSFILWSTGTVLSTIRQVLLFCWLSIGLVVWSRLDDSFVSQILENFVHLIFRYGFWVLHIPFVRMVKFKLLALFPVDHLPYAVVSSLILFCAILQHSLIMRLSYFLRIPNSRVSWSSLTEICVTASLCRSPVLFSVFWPILATLFFWIVSIRLLISNSSSPLCKYLSFSSKVLVLVSLFFSLVRRDNKVHYTTGSSFLNYPKIWSSGRDHMICLYVKIPEKFVGLILQDRFWFVHVPFVRMDKSKFLAQFQVDHLSHPVVSSLIFPLR